MSQQSRKTKETDVKITLNLDGGDVEISTGIGFFDHMLTAFAVHGGFGLCVKSMGDLNVDAHHTVEDVGIVLGKALSDALGDKGGITRYGSMFIPMDEAMALSIVDVSGRPFILFSALFPQERIGDFDTCLCE
ncbi:MAG: imidazoleglycerol-phosphate dehydratase, partial [Oscillospiraceae bacterium]|nr:imidazoleglycerol-phosphate dehydratase [Oscillospiraceae bacterium]